MPNKRILIVDDDVTVSQVTAMMVRRLGHTPIVAWSVESALSMWENTEKAFDFALVDYVMADGVGTAIASRLMKDKPDMPVFLVTGMDIDTVALPSGIGYMGKPFSMDELRAVLGVGGV